MKLILLKKNLNKFIEEINLKKYQKINEINVEITKEFQFIINFIGFLIKL
jgi:hypothetical protein